MLTYGDGLADININDLVKFHKSHGKMLTVTGVRRPSRFGELLEKDGQLMSFMEKPAAGGSLVNGGYMVFNREMMNYLTTDEKCDFEAGPLEEMARRGNVMMYSHKGSWECMDTERDVSYLNDMWCANKAFWKVW